MQNNQNNEIKNISKNGNKEKDKEKNNNNKNKNEEHNGTEKEMIDELIK